jgi:hypothetical protein
MSNKNNGSVETSNVSAEAAMMAEIAALKATIEQQKAALAAGPAPRSLTMKVSEKGACSVYGLGQWPVTLYPSQWTRLLEKAEDIKAFIKANEGKFAVKPVK